jgi:RNA-directed DNA polymerase
MKRIDNIWEEIISFDNLVIAEKKARKGKENTMGVCLFDLDREGNLHRLHDLLAKKQYRTSEYSTFIIHDPKTRLIYKLPYYPDRIVHHAIMNVLESVWVKTFTTDTYACIKKRGINGCYAKVLKALLDKDGTTECLKIDIHHFYPSVNHTILKVIIRKKIKDKNLLWLLDSIIDSAPGLPIGNYLSQFLANLYLAYFDHYVKEVLKVKYYFRYADDMVFLSNSKDYLRKIFVKINAYMCTLKLEVKKNWQIFPVDSRGLDFVGYVFRHTHVLMRKSIKKHFCKKVKQLLKKNINPQDFKQAICSWLGWCKYSNSIHLLKTIIKNQEYYDAISSVRQ